MNGALRIPVISKVDIMIARNDLVAEAWPDYELLDSGSNRKLERYGAHILIRPETQAIWQPQRREIWKDAQAEFLWEEGRGSWRKRNLPEEWELAWNDLRFLIRPTSFKHTGVFPEQAVNWEWLRARLQKIDAPEVLNLFGYTGIASLAASSAGARVTHADASKQSNAWAKENARLSGISEGAIRFILDDAVKFAEREVRRGTLYDGIILDPPAFGRGAKGEVWRIEEDLPRLLTALQSLLNPRKGSFFLLNGYAAGYSPHSFRQAVEGVFKKVAGEFGELQIKEGSGDRVIPAGIYVRFVA